MMAFIIQFACERHVNLNFLCWASFVYAYYGNIARNRPKLKFFDAIFRFSKDLTQRVNLNDDRYF